MLTHFGDFLCSLGEKGPFKTDAALWSVALWQVLSAFWCMSHNGCCHGGEAVWQNI
jgi:hypothetical protein